MASLGNSRSVRKKTTKNKNTGEMKNIMKDWHNAVYHKSVFSLSSELETKETEQQDQETMCRICQSLDDSIDNQQVTPCACSGSLRYVHMMCLQQWRKIKQAKGCDVSICELCKQPYNIELLGSTDVQPDHIMKLQEDLRQLVKSGVYLMLMMRSLKNDVISAQADLRLLSSDEMTSSNVVTSSTNEENQRKNHIGNLRRSNTNSPQSSDNEDNQEYISRQTIKLRSKKYTRKSN
ncbi:uncharacterized protein LOC100175070 [Ciona intestinalis]